MTSAYINSYLFYKLLFQKLHNIKLFLIFCFYNKIKDFLNSCIGVGKFAYRLVNFGVGADEAVYFGFVLDFWVRDKRQKMFKSPDA